MLNIPNMLSIFRLCVVPVFVVLYFSGLEHARGYAALAYAIASFTDLLDGQIARRFGMITNLGKVLDPLGDKVLTFSVLACMSIDGIIPPWAMLIFIVKEAAMGLGGLIIHRVANEPIPQSNAFGKAATALFFIVCAALILFDGIPYEAAIGMISLVLAVSFAALISYSVMFLEIMKKNRKD